VPARGLAQAEKDNMTDFVSLACPHCGGKLEITSDIDRFACMYCGSEQIVNRRGGIISLSLITDAISKVSIGTDKTAAELALVRLQKEYDNLQIQREDLVAQYPEPSGMATGAGLLLLILGVGSCILPILNPSGDLSGCLTPGIILAIIGGLLFLLTKDSHRNWESRIATYVDPIDQQIEDVQIQYKKNQVTVSK
jgi:predicted RNA-binding Zn-ribbon protein involved in translation (DUF1610 family)